MQTFDEMINDVITTQLSVATIAKNNNIYVRTLSKRLKSYLNVKSVDDVIKWCNIVNDTRKIITSKDVNTLHLWNEILERTNFLPPSSGIRERLWYIANKTTNPPTCGCGAPVSWDASNQKGFNRFCGDHRCVYTNRSAQLARTNTNMKQRGVAHVYLDAAVKLKRDATMIKKYGSTSFNHSKISDVSANILNDVDAVTNLYNTHKSTFRLAEILGVSQSYVSKRMFDLGINADSHNSNFEVEIATYIKSLNFDYVKTRTLIPPMEIDIFIPDRKIAIECDGIYWHSEHFKHPTYHLEKTKLCEAQGVRLIHIFEHEFKNTPNIVKSRISSLLGLNDTIAARKCTINTVDFATARDFFNLTHIQGGCKSMSVIIGLYFDKELVACMAFCKSRFNNKISYELIRYSSKLHTNVIGGASKLFKHFLKNYSPNSIISYSDKRWNTGSLYQQLGFNYSHTSAPNFYYFKQGYNDTLLSRLTFQKHKLSKILPIYDSSLTAYQNMKNNNYERIWDCGNTVWIYNE